MSKPAAIIILGFLSLFLPFTGLPSGAKMLIAVFIGLAIMALGFLVRQEHIWLKRALASEHSTDAYAENGAAYKETQTV